MTSATRGITALLLLFGACTAYAQDHGYVVTERTRAALERMTRETFRLHAGDKVPEFSVTMLDGTTVSSSDLRGKTVLINFWGTLCPPCRAELARIESELLPALEERAFVFLPIACEGAEAVSKCAEERGYRFVSGTDPDRTVMNLFCGPGIPRNIVVDPTGKIISAEAGYLPDRFEAMAELIRRSVEADTGEQTTDINE